MTEPASSLNKHSVTPSELEVESIDGSLSPVLSTSKINRRILLGRRHNRQRSRIQLLNRLQTCPAESESYSANLSCSPTCSSSQQSNQSSNTEERLRKLKQVEEDRKRCYNYICGASDSERKSRSSAVRDFEWRKPLSEASSSRWETNSTSSRNDRGESNSVLTTQTPSDKSFNLLSVVNEQSEPYDTLNSTKETHVQVKNQRLSRIPRPNRPLKNTANQTSNCLKVTCDFQSASGKEIVVSETDISTIKVVFSDENLSDVLKSSLGKGKVSVRTSSGSNLLLAESTADRICAASHTMNKIFSNGNFHELSSETNSFFNDKYPADTRTFGVKSGANCNVSDSTVDSTNIKLALDGEVSQNKFFNCVSDTQMMLAVDNALSAMEFCSDDWGDSFCKVNQKCSEQEAPQSKRNSSKDVAYIHSQPQVDEYEDFSLKTQETFRNVASDDTANTKAEENVVNDCRGVTSKNVVNVNIPPPPPPQNIVDCRKLHTKNLIELHRNKNFLGNSEESMHASSNMDHKISPRGVEAKYKTVKTHRKCVSVKCEGFCECEQQEAEERLIKVIKTIKKKEVHLNEMEKSHRKEKKEKNRHIIGDVIQEEGDENVIEQEEHPNVAVQEKTAADKKTKRKKDKSKHHRSKDVALEAELHMTKKMKHDCKEANADGNEEKKSKHKQQKFIEAKEEDGLEPSTCIQLPEKPKKCNKNHKQRRISCADNQNTVEPSPNQKKLKIEIDCTNKLRINISCNAQSPGDKQNSSLIENELQVSLKNTCDKSTSVSRNILAAHTHDGGENSKSSAVEGNGSPKIRTNTEYDKQQHPPDYCSLDFNLKKEKMCKKITKRPQKIHAAPVKSKKDHVDYDTQKNIPEKDTSAPKKYSIDSELGKTAIGFVSASGKQIKISADALKRAERRFETEEDSCVKTNKKMLDTIKQSPLKEIGLPCDFTLASGKSITLSEDAIKKAESVCQEIIEIDTKAKINKERDYSSGDYSSGEKENKFVGFKSASGKNVLISEGALNQAQKLYENMNLSMGDFEKPTCAEEPNKEIHASPSKKAFELLEDVVLTVDNAIERINNKSKKKRLGVSRCKQIPISKERLHQAKTMFEDLRDTPENSTPIKNEGLQLQAKARSSLFPNPELSPIVMRKGNEDLSSSIILHNTTEGNINKWQEEISKQIIELRRKLEVLGERKIGLEIQKDSLQFGDREHRRQRPGVLFTSKQAPKKRVSLKSLQWAEGTNTMLSETILEMIPKNAEYLHFNYARLNEKDNVCMQATSDGAMVIPNLMNLVGLSEIEVAFKTMAGVEPGLIPPGWIANHYQLIVWKLASYERVFPHHLKGSLCVENIIQQLKYRYDREIDRAERSALRKILEKDDVPQKRMVLCVSEICRVGGNKIELQLSDGWYFLKTIIDDPLSRQVQRNKIRIGTKLVTQMAELLNCEGCHPLQVADIVKLRIAYNCTRRALWYAKLGYQRYPEPFTIPMKTIHPSGGTVACLKMYVARVYPLRYLEQVGGAKIWRNEKAERNRAREFENEQLEKMEKIHYDVERECAKEMQQENTTDNAKLTSKAELQKITCPKTLFNLIENSNDPDSLMETLSTSQRIAVLEYRQNISLQRQQDISRRIAQQVEKLKLTKRKVVPILKLLVLDADVKLERAYQFYVWNPTEEHLYVLKEDSVFLVYNITPRFNGDLFSNSKTHFKLEKSISSCHSKTKRQLYPLAMIQDPYYKPCFNEFDTVGLVVQVNEAEGEQELWLGDFIGRILYVKIKDGPKVCCLLDGVTRGEIVSLSNLIYCQPQKDFAQAIANQFTVISSYPQQKFLQEGIELFKIQVSKDLTKLLNDCDKLIAKCHTNIHPIKQAVELTSSSIQNSSNISEVADDSSEDNSVIPTRLTATDIAMSLIDTQQFY